MDTISREPASSPLPLVGVIAGLLALVLAAVALVKVSTANKGIADNTARIVAVEGLGTEVAAVKQTANQTKQDYGDFRRSVQDYLNKLSPVMADLQTKVEELGKRPVPAVAAAGKGGTAPAPAGPGEYIIKSGDTFVKIAAAHGTTSAALQEANPSINPNRMPVGAKIRIPGAARK